ncbi:hypothetical protein MRBLMR1_004863 [Neorhizobium sp. LMR1-1-1.1]
MADELSIDPIAVDWCARAIKLRKVEEALLSGEMVTEARFGEDMSRYTNASLVEVQRALNEAIRNCQISRGEKPARIRFAARGIMRPY